MHLVMVAVAQQHQVVEFGGAHVSPVVDVLGVAPGDFAIATRVAAASIARGHGTEQIGWNGARRPAVVEHGVACAENSMDDAVA